MRKKRSFTAKALVVLFTPFVKSKLKNKAAFKDISQPCVFVCNHSELFGPMTCAVSLPYSFRPWVNERMLDKNLAKKHVMDATMIVKKWPMIFKNAYATASGSMAAWGLNKFNPISVGKSDMRSVNKMIEESLDSLVNGDNLLIFPEDPSDERFCRYKKIGLSPLRPAFSHLAKKYYEKTGQILHFYPLYADRVYRTMQIGNVVVYNPSNPSAMECRRITTEVENEIRQLYANIEGKKLVMRHKKRIEKDNRRLEEIEQIYNNER